MNKYQPSQAVQALGDTYRQLSKLHNQDKVMPLLVAIKVGIQRAIEVEHPGATSDQLAAALRSLLNTTYTVVIEAGSDDGRFWQAIHPAETCEGDSAQEVAQWTAANQTIIASDRWRIRVWEGADADQGSEPAYVWTPADADPMSAYEPSATVLGLIAFYRNELAFQPLGARAGFVGAVREAVRIEARTQDLIMTDADTFEWVHAKIS